MAKSKKAAPAKKGAKTKAKLNKVKLDKKTEAAAVAKVTENRELKYIYSPDVSDPLARKAFRQKVRAKIKSFNKRIENFDGSKKDQKALVKEFNTYKATVLA
jgi:hypothetical protein